MIEQLVGRVFATRSAAHLAHWASKRYGEHVALDEFYNGIISALDEIVECFQGRFDLLDAVEVAAVKSGGTIIERIKSEMLWIEQHRAAISGKSETVGALVDDLAAVYAKAAYKLENLK